MKTLLLVAAALIVRGEIVDRIAANVGSRIIAESEVREQIAVTGFQEGIAPDMSAENRRKMVDRLIDQTLLRREIEFVRFQGPTDSEIAPLLEQEKSRYPSEEAFREALAKYGITEADLLARLRWQLTMLRFIEYRFQPSVEVNNAMIRQEYRRQASAWREKNGTEPPTLEQIRPEVEKIVRQQLIDSAIDRWLGEARTQNTVIYHEGYK